MKPRLIALQAIAASVLLTGCATTDTELSQKEREKMEREQARASQKRAQADSKMMRGTTQGMNQGTSRRGSR